MSYTNSKFYVFIVTILLTLVSSTGFIVSTTNVASSTTLPMELAGQPITLLSGLAYPSALAFDSSGNLYIANYNSITVIPAHTFAISTSSLPNATVNSYYSATLSSSGGILGKEWSISSGTLPPGLSLNPKTGTITGTPTTSESSTFTVTETDAITQVSKQLSIDVVGAPTPTTAAPTTTTTIATKAAHKVVEKKAKKEKQKKIAVKGKVIPTPKPTKKAVSGATTVHTGEPQVQTSTFSYWHYLVCCSQHLASYAKEYY